MFRKVLFLLVLVFPVALPFEVLASGVYLTRTNYSVGSGPASLCLANLRGKISGSQVFRDFASANFSADTVSVRLCLDDGTFGQRTDYPVGHQPSSILYGDFNNDGWGDLVTANAGTNTVSVLRNLGVGANFAAAEDFVEGATDDPGPSGVTCADLDKDGKTDIIVANFNEDTVSVLFNLGDMSFDTSFDFEVGAGPSFIFAKDLNADGIQDIMTANKTDGSVSVLFGLDTGLLSTATNITLYPGGDPQPVCIAAADLNGDGFQDIITANYNSNTVSILFGTVTTGGVWQVTSQTSFDTGTHPKSLCVRDFNADGLVDFAVAEEGSSKVRVFLGTGFGNFVEAGDFTVGSSPAGLAGSNLNGDQSTDLVSVNGDNTATVLLFAGPVAYNNVSKTVYEDNATSVTLTGALLNGTPAYRVASLPAHGSVSSTNSQTFNYTPTNDYFGPDSFTFVTVDTNNFLTSSIATITINVLPVNDPPSFSITTNLFTVMEDSARTNFSGITTNLSPGPTNETGQTFTFVVSVPGSSFYAVKPTITPSGTLSFKPAIGAKGTNVFQVRVRDSGGTVHGGVNLSAPQDITVVVTPHPLKPHRGIYAGLFIGTNGVVTQPDSGFFTFSMAAYGKFSGYTRGDGGKHVFTGQFDLSGHANVTVTRTNGPLDIDLQLDLTNGTDQVAGLITNGTSFNSSLLGDRGVYSGATNPCPLAGLYTLIVPGNANPTNGPGGDSYGTISVNSSGVIAAAGKLSDNTAFSQSVRVSKYGNWPFYVSVLSGRGGVVGWLNFTNLADRSIEGNVSWIKPSTTSKYYSLGFTNFTAAIGSTYGALPDTAHVIHATNCLITVSGGNVNGSFTYPATLDDAGVLTAESVTFLSFANSTIGRMTGAFPHPVTGVQASVNAVPLQQQDSIRGFFLGSNLSGKYDVEPND